MTRLKVDWIRLTLLRAQTSEPNSISLSISGVLLSFTASIRGVLPVTCKLEWKFERSVKPYELNCDWKVNNQPRPLQGSFVPYFSKISKYMLLKGLKT
jgi:hypothetical protein